MKLVENIFYTDLKHHQQTLDIYLPEEKTFPVLIYFHGGGIVSGDKTNGKDTYIKALVEKGIAVISANYRMYPDAKYPDFIYDAASAVAWTMRNISEYGEAQAFFVGGSSAGGYLSQMLCFDKKYLDLYRVDSDSINGYIHNAGQPTVHYNVLRERGIDSRRVLVDDAAPLFHITKDRNYAPMQIIYAENDMENRPEQLKLLVSTLKHFGCNMDNVELIHMEGYGHCEYDEKPDENGNSILAEVIGTFISKHSK